MHCMNLLEKTVCNEQCILYCVAWKHSPSSFVCFIRPTSSSLQVTAESIARIWCPCYSYSCRLLSCGGLLTFLLQVVVCVPHRGISSMSQQRLMVFVTFRLFRLVPKRKTWNFKMAGLLLSFCFLANYIWRWTRPGNGITFAHFPLPSLAWQPRWDETKLAPGLYSTESTLEIDSQRLAWQSVGQTCIIQYV